MKRAGDGAENRLANETSAYLLAHSRNPVDWRPWGKEAFDEARRTNKPILLSIGYSSCHWCHVMAEESFEDPAIAEIMNEHFVCIKVDREERPDVDDVYMKAVQLMTGSGGWPLTVFLTPDLVPFFGGTYFPPDPRGGIPAFPDLVAKLGRLCRENPGKIAESAAAMTRSLRRVFAEFAAPAAKEKFSSDMLDRARANLLSRLDREDGGFGGAPKFPNVPGLLFLLAEHRRTGEADALAAVTLTLDKMASGGIRDQLDGGFHRYAVDASWRVPHFEKMLYDNALLARVYIRAWQAGGQPRHAEVARGILDFLLKEMRSENGAFFASIDADSGGEEGAFYLWRREEIVDVLGTNVGRRFCAAYGITEEGNFDGGRNVLHLALAAEQAAANEGLDPKTLVEDLERSCRALLAARETRTRPSTDRKIITAWNGLAIAAFALGGMVLGEKGYTAAARKAADFLLDRHMKGGRLTHSSVDAKAGGKAFLDDYVYLADGLLALYGATFDAAYLLEAERLARMALTDFRSDTGGPLRYAAPDGEISPPVRAVKIFDDAVPSPNAVALDVGRRIALIGMESVFSESLDDLESALASAAARVPEGNLYALASASADLVGRVRTALAGNGADATAADLARTARERMPAGGVLLFKGKETDAAQRRLLTKARALRDMRPVEGRPAAYVCRGKTCLPPATDAAELVRRIENAVSSNRKVNP